MTSRRSLRSFPLRGMRSAFGTNGTSGNRYRFEYLPGTDQEAPLLLRESCSAKSTARKRGQSYALVKLDVLQLYASQTKNASSPHHPNLASRIKPFRATKKWSSRRPSLPAGHKPVIIQAAGGVGKSVFATRIAHHLPGQSVCIFTMPLETAGIEAPLNTAIERRTRLYRFLMSSQPNVYVIRSCLPTKRMLLVTCAPFSSASNRALTW